MNGRVFEINRQKQIVWLYNNLIAKKGVVGIVEGSERLSLQFNRVFFNKQMAVCRQ